MAKTLAVADQDQRQRTGAAVRSIGPRRSFSSTRESLVQDGARQDLREIASASFDPDLTGVGSSPYLGDMGRTGVTVPAAFTVSQDTRYLIRLCGVEIPAGYAIVIRGLRQLATIRGCTGDGAQPSQDFPPDCLLTLEREVVSPLWSFLDGNISWHLRWQKNRFSSRRVDPSQLPGTSPNTRSLESVLLYVPTIAAVYVPPASGQPPGDALGALGTFRDIRFPWGNTDYALSEVVRGPGAVAFYASVRQTNPSSRPPYPNLPGMRPEDQFLSSFPNAIYGRVAGAMLFEAFPCDSMEGPVVP